MKLNRGVLKVLFVEHEVKGAKRHQMSIITIYNHIAKYVLPFETMSIMASCHMNVKNSNSKSI